MIAHGPIKPNSIKELIVFKYWNKQRKVRLLELIIPIASKNNSENLQTLINEYISFFSNNQAEEFRENNVDILKQWIETKSLQSADLDDGPNTSKQYDYTLSIGDPSLSQSLPKEWDGFVRAKFNHGRGKT